MTTTLAYQTTTDGLTEDQLTGGFFQGWPNPPSPATHLRILEASDHKVVAIRDDQVIGFMTAISDGVLSAYITLIEVLPEERGKGIGQSLINQLLDDIGDIYMIDLTSDADFSRFYAELGFATSTSMSRRDYAMQAGRPT